MTRRGPLLATGLGVLAIGVAGCGGGGGGAAVGTTNDMGTVTAGATTTTTGTSTGGVLGAQANIDRQRLRREANRIQVMLNRQVEQLRNASSTEDLAAAATSIRAQLLQAADRLDRVQVQNPQLQQQRADLASALRSLSADVTTLKGDAKSGNLQKAMTDLTNLSSLTQVRQSIQAIQQQNGSTQSVQSQASTVVGTLQMRLLRLAGTNDAQTFAKRADQLRGFLDARQRQLRAVNVPQGQQQRKQTLLDFLSNWKQTVTSARDQARNDNLQQAKRTLSRGSLADIQGLLSGLTSSSG